MTRDEAHARISRCRDWAALVGARRLGHALSSLMLAADVAAGTFWTHLPRLARGDAAQVRADLAVAGPALLDGVPGAPQGAGCADLVWAREELEALSHPASVSPSPAAGECGGPT